MAIKDKARKQITSLVILLSCVTVIAASASQSYSQWNKNFASHSIQHENGHSEDFMQAHWEAPKEKIIVRVVRQVTSIQDNRIIDNNVTTVRDPSSSAVNQTSSSVSSLETSSAPSLPPVVINVTHEDGSGEPIYNEIKSQPSLESLTSTVFSTFSSDSTKTWKNNFETTVKSTSGSGKITKYNLEPTPEPEPEPVEANGASSEPLPSTIHVSMQASTTTLVSKEALQTKSSSPEPPTPEPVGSSLPEPIATTEPSSKPADISSPEPEDSSSPGTSTSNNGFPEPYTSPEPIASPEPNTSPEPNSSPEPITSPESEPITLPEPEPSTSPEPITSPEPSTSPEPITSPEPSTSPEPITSPEPSTSPEPITSPEPSTSPEPITSPEPNTSPEPITLSKPNTSPEPSGSSLAEFSSPETSRDSSPKPFNLSSTPDPEGGPNPSAEPETPLPESEPEPKEPIPFAEREPEWDLAKEKWKWGWEFLIYFFGVMFFILALFSFLCVIRLWKMNHLISRNYFLTLNVLIIMKCLLRAAYLLIDAYNVNDTFNTVVHYFIYSTAFPCLTSAFSILFYALLVATKMQVISAKVQKLSVLIGIIVFHFVLSITTDVVVGLFAIATVLLLVCQFFYILWGLVLFVGYFYLFRRLLEAAVKRQKNLYLQTSSSPSEVSQKNEQKPHKKAKYTISLSIKVTFIAAIFGLFCVGIELFGVFGVYRLDSIEHTPEPWPWYIYQFLLRLMELLMCCTMVFVASQPLKYNRKSDENSCFLYLLPCNHLLCCGNCGKDPTSDSHSWSLGRKNSDSQGEGNHVVKMTDIHYVKNEKKVRKSRVHYSGDANGTLSLERPTHLVIEDGLVRFRSTDDIADSDSEIGTTSLPDLLNGSVPHADSVAQQNGVLNSAYNRSDSDQNNDIIPRISPTDCQNALPSQENDRCSVGTTGTDTLNQISTLNLAASLEWEFDQAFERSFGESEVGSTKSLPNASELSHDSSDVQKHLLSSGSPNHSNQSDTKEESSTEGHHVTFDLSKNSTSPDCSSPTRKPLIKKRQSSYDTEETDPYSKFKINIYNS